MKILKEKVKVVEDGLCELGRLPRLEAESGDGAARWMFVSFPRILRTNMELAEETGRGFLLSAPIITVNGKTYCAVSRGNPEIRSNYPLGKSVTARVLFCPGHIEKLDTLVLSCLKEELEALDALAQAINDALRKKMPLEYMRLALLSLGRK